MIGEKETKTDMGKIKIHSKAIRSIAAIAAMEVEGVLMIYSGSLGKILEIIGKDMNFMAIKVDLKANNEIDMSIAIAVEYGRDIPKVAADVQENIRYNLEKMTGLIPVNIDVKVKTIEKKK